jgi:hypothetical protein
MALEVIALAVLHVYRKLADAAHHRIIPMDWLAKNDIILLVFSTIWPS